MKMKKEKKSLFSKAKHRKTLCLSLSFRFVSLSLFLETPRPFMEHLVGGRGQRRRTSNARYDYDQVDDSDSDSDDSGAFVDENNAQRRLAGGGGGRRAGALADAAGNGATVPRSADQVVEDIRSAVKESLAAASQRENSLFVDVRMDFLFCFFD